ncbi:MAG: hypothetical protein HY812_11665 [Planctomycetes bacterium]|nr:hypothetical protein [Planctomycetota bacterium]
MKRPLTAIVGLLFLAVACFLALAIRPQQNEPVQVETQKEREPDPAPPTVAPILREADLLEENASQEAVLEIVFVRQGGDEPVPGVEVELAPATKVLPEPRDPALTRVSDAQGFVTWTMPAGNYHYAIRSSHATHRRFDARREPWAGSVVLAAGEPARLVLEVFGGTVRATLVCPGEPSDPVHARIYDRVRHAEGPISQEDRTEEYSQFPGRELVFTGISAGEKGLKALVRTEQDGVLHVHFFWVPFLLGPDESKNLGELLPLQGADLGGTVVFAGPDGEIPQQEIFPALAEPLRALLLVENVEPDADDDFGMQVLEIALGKPFLLHGLRQQRHTLTADQGYLEQGSWPLPAPGLELQQGSVRATPPAFELRVPLHVGRTVPVTFVPVWKEPFRLTVVLLSLRDARPHEFRFNPREHMTVSLATGTYRLMAHADPAVAKDCNQVYAALVEVLGPTEVPLAFAAGATAQGTTSFRGAPLADTPLGFSPEGWVDGPGNLVYTHQCVTAPDGSFRVAGLPPGTTIHPCGGFAPFTAPPAGQTKTVELTRPR